MAEARARGSQSAAHRSIEKLKATLASNWVKVRDVFMHLDSNGDGLLDRTEWCRVTAVLGGLTRSDASVLFDAIDSNRSGTVDFQELNRRLSGSAVKSAHALRTDIQRTHSRVLGHFKLKLGVGETVLEQIQAALNGSFARVRDLWNEWDEDESGHIDSKELFTALALLGLRISREESDELFEELDAGALSRVS